MKKSQQQNVSTDKKSITAEFADSRKKADEVAAKRDVYKSGRKTEAKIHNVRAHNQLVILAVRGAIGREEDLDDEGWAVLDLLNGMEENMKVLEDAERDVETYCAELHSANTALDLIAKSTNQTRTELVEIGRKHYLAEYYKKHGS